MTFDGAAILITGANRGLGKALVHEALARGVGRVYAGTRGPLGYDDDRVTALTLDVTDPAQVSGVVAAVDSLDVLINNAGIMHPDLPFDPDVLARHLEVNVFGTARMTQAFLPALTRSRGRVINMLSVVALAPLPMFPSYSSSKAAAFSLTKSFRALHAADGVRFHAVLAGPIDTDMTRALPVPKIAPADAAAAIFDAVDAGKEEIFPDVATSALEGPWATGADKLLEAQFAQLIPAAMG